MSESFIPERDADGNIIRDADGEIVYRPVRRIDQETTDTPNQTRGPTTPDFATAPEVPFLEKARQAGLNLVDGKLQIPTDYGLTDTRVVAYIKDLLSLIHI